jgi:collagenase-like PrtC family protease
MKLLAPARNYSSALLQIESGANELYIGCESSVFKNITFTGRGKYNINGENTTCSFSELKDIIDMAHTNGVFVMFAANIPFFAEDISTGKKIEKAFIEYIESGLKANVDSLILGDLGTILLLKKLGIKSHFTASTFFETTNKDQIIFLKQLGFNRVVLSYQMKLQEIIELAGFNLLELEVFGHYGCSFYDGYCNLKHSFSETKENYIGIPCQKTYDIFENNKIIGTEHFFDSSLACSICSIPALIKSGVHSLKLVGRDKDPQAIKTITEIYSGCINNYSKSSLNDKEFVATYKSKIPKWWAKSLCNHGRCKYINSSIAESFV